VSRRGGTAADALSWMQRAAPAPSPVTRQPTLDQAPVGEVPAAAPALERGSAPAPAAPAGAADAKRVSTRTTVDLDPGRYQLLRQYSVTHRCKGAEVIQALLDELGRDPELTAVMAARLRQTGIRRRNEATDDQRQVGRQYAQRWLDRLRAPAAG